MYLLKVPSFMSIEPQVWDHTTFQPPQTEHHQYGAKPNSDTFSSYKTALSTIRWRHSPSNPSQLQSNARILRWSDGSLTLQLASDPTTQYDMDGKAQAPPQRNPSKPTPTSVQGSDAKYNKGQDTYTYLLRPYDENGTMIVTQRITAGLSVKPAGEDDALERLQASLAAAANASKVKDATGEIPIEYNPETGKKEAEKAMQEQDRARKKLKAAADREAARADRTLGRAGLGRDRYSGLNVGMLEDEDEEGGGRGRAAGNRKRPKPRRRRNSEYSDDEDFGRKRFSREDEYDEDDDFLARSDEEEVVEDDEDPDDGIVEEERPSSSRRARERTPKRGRDDDGEADAEGEEEEEVPQAVRTKKRRIVDEDEDDE